MWRLLPLLLLLGCPQPDPAPEPEPEDEDDRVVAMIHGGGSEDDDLFARFVDAAGGGHLVTLGAVPDPEDYEYLDWWDGYFVSLGAASAETINALDVGEASTPEVVEALEAADGVFLRGGDQSRYVAWAGTPLHDGLQAAIDRGVVVGGSSAGAAVLGEQAYDARVCGVAAWEALLEPWNSCITFTERFLDLLPDVLVDTHFTERGRLGRLSVFVEFCGAEEVVGVGVDPRTALFVRADGIAEVVGDGTVTLLRPSGDYWFEAGEPAVINGQGLTVLEAGHVVDLSSREVLERPVGVVPVTTAAQPLAWTTPLVLDGDDGSLASAGDVSVDAETGEVVDGDGLLPGTLVVPELYADSDHYESTFEGLQRALAARPDLVAIGIDIYLGGLASPPGELEADPGSYLLVIDGRFAEAAGGRSLEGATLDVVGPPAAWRDPIGPP